MVFLSHRCQNVKNVQETFINTKNSLLKPFLDHRVQNVREVSSKTSPWRKQDWIPRNKISWQKAFLLSTKRKLSILLNFLFPFMSFIGVFSMLKCKTLVLKTTTWWPRASHLVDECHLLKCQIRVFPHSQRGWPFDFWGDYGWFQKQCPADWFPKKACK